MPSLCSKNYCDLQLLIKIIMSRHRAHYFYIRLQISIVSIFGSYVRKLMLVKSWSKNQNKTVWWGPCLASRKLNNQKPWANQCPPPPIPPSGWFWWKWQFWLPFRCPKYVSLASSTFLFLFFIFLFILLLLFYFIF